MESSVAFELAIRRIWHALRCNLCERLVSWSLKVSPNGYVPSFIECVVEAHKGVPLEEIGKPK